jgi:hypothetical protein
LKRIDAMKSVPAWAFNSSRDHPDFTTATSQTVAALNSAGGTAWLTEVPAKNLDYHNAWQEAFIDHDLLTWLLNQSKGQSIATRHWSYLRHNHLNLRYLVPRLIPISLGLIVVFVWRRERRRNALLDAKLNRINVFSDDCSAINHDY